MSSSTRYKKIKTEGEGGFGKTERYLDTHLERKVIKKSILDPLETDRLVHEIEALQKAKSKNVVQIYDVIFSDDGSAVAIIEEFLPGDDLSDFRADNDNIIELMKILYQLASGLSDIHDCDIVHRDFKPNNVKYDEENILQIFDFGLAKYDALPASTVGLIGTHGFMAPELYLDKPIIDKPVDSYAFGATSFFFVLGRPPKCALKRPKPRPLKPSESIGNYITLNKNISDLLDSCLDIDPQNRPPLHQLREAFKNELLHGKHKATIILGNHKYILDTSSRAAKIARGNIDTADLIYDGYEFKMRNITGNVYVNNIKVTSTHSLVGSSVIALGSPDLGGFRRFVTFDISHPEVIL